MWHVQVLVVAGDVAQHSQELDVEGPRLALTTQKVGSYSFPAKPRCKTTYKESVQQRRRHKRLPAGAQNRAANDFMKTW